MSGASLPDSREQSRGSAVKIPGLSPTLSISCACLGLFIGCAANPHAVNERLHAVERSRVFSTFNEALAAARIETAIPGNEIKISVTESDRVFDAGWTLSYFRILLMEGVPRRHYRCTIKSICDCFGLTKTLPVPYVYVVDELGNSLGEGPHNLTPRDATLTLPIHLEGGFDLVAGSSGRCYFLVLADNRDTGQPVTNWHTRHTSSDGTEMELQGDIVSSPVGTVRLEVEQR
jgi:hypothetical protein